jgi:signal transduction histidine kinase
VQLHIDVARLPAGVETTAYFVVAEALTNVVKHARATSADVGVTIDAEVLVVEVRDDGRGGADPAAGTGLTGLRDRVEAAGGRLRVDSPTGRGTTVRAELAVDLDSGTPG